ncbi:Na+/H+ antiporter NhaA [Chryseobacterium sp. cx-311]|uniref:Na+/H+ antiporter NhaA n=1 Tax=Marnyiella aurantia TaxID=2758037 RepID=UPI001AE4BA7B|nr:Na+/H+ antiporter NhaA [Marnyiella aurantia]MBP0611616.1 Na+/H+ antiporter NhaA [Marnyiella aurantia]
MKLTTYFQKFFQSSQSSGILLLGCVIISLLIANSGAGSSFANLLQYQLGPYSTSVWINDGLMAIFFLLVGLEIKREIVEGELSSFNNASLPIFAAIGGMVVPALIFAFFNSGTEYANGWGIPMATDIAFSLAIVAMLGSRVPASIKIFLAALAIVDDLGAIMVIAIFYTEQIHWIYLLFTALVIILLIFLNRFKVTRHIYYLIPGIFLWYFMHHSGIHATIAGVILAFTIPTNASHTEISPLEKLEHRLHTPVNFLIMPLFALANTNILFKSGMVEGLFSTLGYGIILGLVAGKLIGITLFSGIAIRTKLSSLPADSNWTQMIGTALLAGIGFTMSIFIALLSYKGHLEIQEEAKFAILVASAISGVSGYLILRQAGRKKTT